MRPLPSSAAEMLVLVRLVLVGVFLSIFLVGDSAAVRPLGAWSMYDAPMTVAHASRPFVYAHENSGRVHIMPADTLMGLSRSKFGRKLVLSAFSDDPDDRARGQQLLARLVSIRLSQAPLRKIEVWEHGWAVSPDVLPPLVREQPDSLRLLGRFTPVTVRR